MSAIFIIAIVILGAILYKMLSGGEKAYVYNRTVVLSIDNDGFEQTAKYNESGMVFIKRKQAIIDGESFPYKPTKKNRRRARLQYDGNNLRSVSIRVPTGEKFFYVDKKTSIASMVKRQSA